MGFLFKLTIVFTVVIAVIIGYSQISQEAVKVPITWEAYWGRGDPKPDDPTVQKFKVNVRDDVLKDLKSRLENTRFGESLEGGDFHYGFQSTYLKEVVSYWKNKYDWRKQEAILNSFPQFKTQIRGLNIHFIHAKPKGNIKGKPLLISHGWPGSIWEFYKIIPMLTDPVSHGGQPEDAFEVIAPSIPGFGFSEQPHKKGFDQADTMMIYHELMLRLGHKEFYIQAGDWGSTVATFMAANFPKNVLGVHLNLYSPGMNDKMASIHNIIGNYLPSLVFDKVDADVYSRNPSPFLLTMLQESGYFHLQATKPDTVGAGLVDSPAGLAAYILEKFSGCTNMAWRDLPDGGLTKNFSLDELLTNVMIYWINGNMMSSQRYYKEYFISDECFKMDSLPVTVPSGLASFPNEFMLVPRAIAGYKFKDIVQFSVMPRGGHFAAFEEPRLLAEDLRSFVRKVVSSKKR